MNFTKDEWFTKESCNTPLTAPSDVLLQEHGYFILRFLTTDLAKNLDRALDSIQRALAHSRQGNGDS